MDFEEDAESPGEQGQAQFAAVDLESEFSIFTPAKEENWMEHLEAVDFPKPAETKSVITFEEAPPIFNSSRSSGSRGRPVAQMLVVDEQESFEVITYESPAGREEAKHTELAINLERMKVEGVDAAGDLATSSSEQVDTVSKSQSASPGTQLPAEEAAWPELTIQLPETPNPAIRPLKLPALPPAANPAFLQRRRFQKSPVVLEAKAKVSLQPEFEEDAMGEAREWQAYSANPELNDDQQDDRGDEFSLDLKAEVAIRAGGEKKFTSGSPEVVLREVPKRQTHHRNKKVGLRTRQMIAEAKLAEKEAKIDSTPDPPASTPLKISYNLDFPTRDSPPGFAEFAEKEEDSKQAEEWNKASAFAFQEMEQARAAPEIRVITYAEAWGQLEQMDISSYVEQEQALRPGRASWLKRCFGAAPEDIEVGELKEKCRRVLALVRVTFDNSALHQQMLVTVWTLLTGRHSCPRFGTHWEEIGFQGSDPATDLRGMGVFGLLQLLYFCCNFNQEAKMVLTQAQQPHCAFPFAAVSINITKIVVDALRGQHLNAYINKWRNVFDSVQFFYVGTYLYWFQAYMQRQATVADVGTLNLEVAKEAKRRPDRIFHTVKQIYHQKGVFV